MRLPATVCQMRKFPEALPVCGISPTSQRQTAQSHAQFTSRSDVFASIYRRVLMSGPHQWTTFTVIHPPCTYAARNHPLHLPGPAC